MTDADLNAARDKVLMGVERRSVVLSDMDRVNCAYHEAGHAVVAALLPDADPLHKVTIIPRGRAMGVTMQLPEADRHTYTKGFLETQVAVLMGGRVAEEIFMNHMTSGASNDIERATDIAQHMVCEWGMSELGPLAYRKPGNAFEADRPHGISEATAQRVDDEIRRVIMSGYDRARGVIENNRDAVRLLAEELLQVESLEADEIRAIMARSSSAEIQHIIRGRMAPASEPVRLERLPAFAWAVIAVVGLSVLYTVVQVVLVRPYLWPAGTGATLAGDPTAQLPLKARPPDVAAYFTSPPEIARVAPGSPADANQVVPRSTLLAQERAGDPRQRCASTSDSRRKPAGSRSGATSTGWAFAVRSSGLSPRPTVRRGRSRSIGRRRCARRQAGGRDVTWA